MSCGIALKIALTGEDDFGGWVIPTGTLRQNISRDIKYAINSRDLNLMAPLIQQFKRIQWRLEIESQQEQQRKQTTEKPAEAEQENKDTKRKWEGEIEPKPPEILQKILWILKYDREHWRLVLLAILVLLICCIWSLLQ